MYPISTRAALPGFPPPANAPAPALRRRWVPWALPGLLLWAALACAQSIRVPVQTAPLAGFQHHAAARLWPQLRVGDALTLVREPGNPHDAQAVRVDWQGQTLGYLPRAVNRAVAAELDAGRRLDARIAARVEAENPWQRILIEVYAPL